MRGVVVAMVASASALAASCDQGKEHAGRTYTDDEIAKLEAHVTMAIENNAARVCPRPPLRDTPSTASVRDSQLALAEPTGDTAACLARFAELRRGLKDDARTRAPGILDTRDPAVVAADADCKYDVEAFVVTATATDAACSPYQSGVRSFPSGAPGQQTLERMAREVMFINVAHAVGVRARIRASSGDPKGGLAHAADGVRLFQDMTRGHTNLFVSMLVRSAERLVLSYADGIVEQLSPADAAELAPMFDALLASEPHVGPMLQGEAEAVMLHLGLARTKPASWRVPGGDSDFTQYRRGTRKDRDEGADLMRREQELASRLERECPGTASHEVCRRGLLATGPVSSPVDVPEPGYFAEYLPPFAETTAKLAATRVALEVRREARCPAADDLASPRYTALLGPAVLGDSLRATLDGSPAKTLRLAPPPWADKKSVSWTIHCP